MNPKRPKFDLLTVGDATWDAVVTDSNGVVMKHRGKKYLGYEYGEKIHLDNAYFSYGGGAANAAVGAARLGLKAGYCGSIGVDRIGKDILVHFKEEKVDTSLAIPDQRHVSALGVVLTAPDGERTILLYDGANRDLVSTTLPWSKLLDTKWLYLPSLPGKSGALYNRLAREAKGHGVKVALNPGAYQLQKGMKGLRAALRHCDVLSLNDGEARELLGLRRGAPTVKTMLRRLYDVTGGTVVITRGSRGVAATDGDSVYDLSIVSSRRVNAVGAGDAFSVTVVTALMKGKSLADALVLASLNASSVVSDHTAQAGLRSWSALLAEARRAPRYRPRITALPKR